VCPSCKTRKAGNGKALSKDEAARAIAELQPSAKSAAGVAIPAPEQSAAPGEHRARKLSGDGLQARRFGRHARGFRQRPGAHR